MGFKSFESCTERAISLLYWIKARLFIFATFRIQDTRCARRASAVAQKLWRTGRAKWMGCFSIATQGSPRGLGQPWALLLDPVGVVRMALRAEQNLTRNAE